jgi:uncharacterized protein (DUF1015 family)
LIYQQERSEEQSDSSDSSSVSASQAKQSLTDKRAFNYVMMELTEFSDPGLVVLPLHRLIRSVTPSILIGLRDQVRNFFAVEFVPLKADSPDASELVVDSCLGILGLQPGSLVILKRRDDVSFEALMPANRSQAYRELGVSIFDHVILNGILNRAEDREVAYTMDLKEAYRQVKEGKYQLAFLSSPPQLEMIKAIADTRDRMPSKSTYFYPKLPAGLVINPLH